MRILTLRSKLRKMKGQKKDTGRRTVQNHYKGKKYMKDFSQISKEEQFRNTNWKPFITNLLKRIFDRLECLIWRKIFLIFFYEQIKVIVGISGRKRKMLHIEYRQIMGSIQNKRPFGWEVKVHCVYHHTANSCEIICSR